MNRRALVVGAIAVGAVVVVAVGWYLASPLFINRMVSEAFPIEIPTSAQMREMSADEMDAMEQQIMDAIPSADEMDAMPERARERIRKDVERFAAAMPDKHTIEPMPGAPVLLAAGEFRDADRFHKGSGLAKLYDIPAIGRVLRFEEFRATNGPDLHVLLAAAPLPTNRHDLGEYIDLGSLKGNVGDQNYEIPEDVDVARYASVVIYCKPFHVVFATATLNRTGGG